MKTSWFSEEGQQLVLQHWVDTLPSWQQAVADGRITAEEVQAQVQRTADLLRQLEDRLDDETHALATQALLEYGVLQAIQHMILARDQAELVAAASRAGGGSGDLTVSDQVTVIQ